MPMTQLTREGYSPIPQAIQEKIFTAWSAYRDTFGLEGEELFTLIQAGASQELISQRLKELKSIKNELLPLWEDEWLTQAKE